MSRPPNRSPQTYTVLRLLSAEQEWWHGYALGQHTRIPQGTLSPLLRRLESQGYLESRWEFLERKGPPRKLYRLTLKGFELLKLLGR
jgi:PadR family transcriptional regulator, regulatory protein PadR